MVDTTGTTGRSQSGVDCSHQTSFAHTLIDLVGSARRTRHGRVSTRRTCYMPITQMFNVHGWGLPLPRPQAGCW